MSDIINVKDLGLDLVVIASIISIAGVFANNIMLDHHLAMLIWRWSNIGFGIYFFGRWKDLWDGGLSDALMCGFYVFCLVTNEIGLRLV